MVGCDVDQYGSKKRRPSLSKDLVNRLFSSLLSPHRGCAPQKAQTWPAGKRHPQDLPPLPQDIPSINFCR